MTVIQIGNATLYHGDCLAQELPPVNATITDPPFEVEAHTLQRRVKRGGGVLSAEPLPFAQIEDRARYARAVAKVTTGWALAFCQAEAVQAWREAFEEAGASYRRAMVWIKPDGMPQYSGDRPGMGYESIVSVWCGKGKSRWSGGGRHGVFTCNKNDGAGPAPHPTTKPRRLMEELVSLFTSPGDVVLDPFMGSGTTGVACANLGRKFVGVEIDRGYFDIACERIEAAYSQARLFDDLDRHAPGVKQSDFGI
jgi:site-specific DNA-methyltransferase (adenine-specific)